MPEYVHRTQRGAGFELVRSSTALCDPWKLQVFAYQGLREKVLLFNGKNTRGCFEAGELLPSRSYVDEFVPTILCDL